VGWHDLMAPSSCAIRAPEMSRWPRRTLLRSYPSPDGGLWIVTTSGLARLRDARVEKASSEPIGDVTDLLVDRAGNIWIATVRSVLVRAASAALAHDIHRTLGASMRGSLVRNSQMGKRRLTVSYFDGTESARFQSQAHIAQRREHAPVPREKKIVPRLPLKYSLVARSDPGVRRNGCNHPRAAAIRRNQLAQWVQC